MSKYQKEVKKIKKIMLLIVVINFIIFLGGMYLMVATCKKIEIKEPTVPTLKNGIVKENFETIPKKAKKLKNPLTEQKKDIIIIIGK